MSPIYAGRRALFRVLGVALVAIALAGVVAVVFDPPETPPPPPRPESRVAQGLDRWYALEWPRREKIEELCVVTEWSPQLDGPYGALRHPVDYACRRRLIPALTAMP